MYEMNFYNSQKNIQKDPLMQEVVREHSNIVDDIIHLDNNNTDFPQKKLFSYRRPFSKFKRKLIFFLIFVINILINLDHGAIPAGTTALKKENNLDNVALGIIGSLVYLGLVLGSISAGPIFESYSSKWVVILTLLISCVFLYFFTVFKGCWGMAFCRVGCGFSQVFCYIYFPVWVDQYGVDKKQTLWLTFLQLGVPVGTMLGYVQEAFYVRKFNQWKLAFYTQILLIFITVLFLVLTPDKFFSRNYRHSESSKEKIEEELNELRGVYEKEDNKNSGRKLRIKNLNVVSGIINNKYGRPSLYSIFSMIDDTEDEGTDRYFSVLRDLIKNKKYIYTMFGISCLLFVVTGLQFWITDYMKEVMGIDSSKVYVIYAVVCITGPVFGVLLGGIFIQYLGGYTNKRALDACFKIAFLAGICCFFLPLLNIMWLFVICMWLLLFFGGSVTPGLTGIMLSSIPEHSKEIGNSVTQLCYNLLGYLPSPFLYGLVCKFTGGSKSRWGLIVILLWAYIGVISLRFATKAQNEEDESGDEVAKMINGETIEEKSNILRSLFGRMSLK